MNIPNFIDSKVVNDDGTLTPIWRSIFMQLFTEMQKNLSEEGIYVPQQPASNISQLNGATGALIYNSDTNKFMCCENGIFKTITTS